MRYLKHPITSRLLDILTLAFFNQHEVLTLNCAVTALDRWESYGMSLINRILKSFTKVGIFNARRQA